MNDSGGIKNVGHAVIVYGFYYYLGNEELRFRVKDPMGYEYICTYNELKQLALSQKWVGVAVRNVDKANNTIPAF